MQVRLLPGELVDPAPAVRCNRVAARVNLACHIRTWGEHRDAEPVH